MDPIKDYLESLKHVLGSPEKVMPLHQPEFKGNEQAYVASCIESGWVSSVGDYVTLFEKKLAAFTGAAFAVAVVNGTAALHVCLLLAEVKPDDEVLVPSLTFVATANAVAYCGAIPHFVDSDFSHLGIEVDKLATYLKENTYCKDNQCINKLTSRRIKAIVPVHIFGHPVDMDTLRTVCKDFHITMIEDASESLGSYYKGNHTGNVGEMACLSFNGNKIITTGGGGAILTNDPALAIKAKHLTTTAKQPHAWAFYHDSVGYNYRLPNINAALGCAQLEQLPSFIKRKRALAQKYRAAFEHHQEVSILQEPHYAKSNYWLNALILNKPNKLFVQNFIKKAHEYHYALRGLWAPLDTLPMYQHCPKMDLSNTYVLFDSVIALPSSAALGEESV